MSRTRDRKEACRYGQEMANWCQFCRYCKGKGGRQRKLNEHLEAVDIFEGCTQCQSTGYDPIPWSELFKK